MNSNIFDSLQESQPVNRNRKSQDSVVNNYAKLLLNLCTIFDLCILNSVCKGDLQGCYKYISDSGISVNDYFLLSNDMYAHIHSTSELCVTARIKWITCRLHSVLYFQRKICVVMKFLSIKCVQ